MANLVRSIPLNWATWDLALDSAGNWNLEPDVDRSTAQDVACAERTFLSECWYDVTLGLPYYQQIFGQNPPLSFLVAKFTAQALTMPNTRAIDVLLLGLTPSRQLTGALVVYRQGSPTPIPVAI